MTQFGPLKDRFILTDLELLGPIPQGGLTTPYPITDVDGITANLITRFPTPPSAFGFLTDVDFGMDLRGITKVIAGAVFPESLYLEPTTGQIWPR